MFSQSARFLFSRVVLVAWGFEMFMESCLKKLEHNVVEVSLCHLGRFADPGYPDEGELRGPWQGLGQISIPRTEMAPSFLLDNIVEILMATGV